MAASVQEDKQVIDQVFTGQVTVTAVLSRLDLRVRAQDLKVYDLLMAQLDWCREQTETVMRYVRIGGARKVGELTSGQRSRLLEAIKNPSAYVSLTDSPLSRLRP